MSERDKPGYGRVTITDRAGAKNPSITWDRTIDARGPQFIVDAVTRGPFADSFRERVQGAAEIIASELERGAGFFRRGRSMDFCEALAERVLKADAGRRYRVDGSTMTLPADGAGVYSFRDGAEPKLADDTPETRETDAGGLASRLWQEVNAVKQARKPGAEVDEYTAGYIAGLARAVRLARMEDDK